MSAQIITLDEWSELKAELIQEVKSVLSEQHHQTPKKWLKSSEVREMLNISPGTLQTLRINGTLPYTKIGGTHYYDAADIDALLSVNNKKRSR